MTNLKERGRKARALLMHTPFPGELRDAIALAYAKLCERYNPDTDVAVRSSATAEDLPDASFAGQQETFLNFTTTQGVLAATHRCFASLFTDRAKFAISDEEILHLAKWACLIEQHYSQVHGKFTPMDIEWALDGITGQLFVVQARPETVQSQKNQAVLRSYHLGLGTENESPQSPIPIVTGRAVGEAISQGKAQVILDAHHIEQFQPGEVLVTDRTDPDWEPIMKKASAIVTNSGGRTCHVAIIARELGVPAIVGCNNATQILKTGQEITVSCAEGEEGRVYQGLLPFEVKEITLENLPRTRTQILMNVGNPQEAFRLSEIPNDGVGLARTEFIIANHIQSVVPPTRDV